MKPIKSSELLEGYAKENRIPEEDLRIMVNAFWQTLRQNLSGLEHVKIKVNGLGHFKMTERKVQEGIAKHKLFRKGYHKITPLLIAKNEEKIDTLEQAWEKVIIAREDLWRRQKLKKQYKDELAKNKRESETGMGQEGSDS